MSNKRLQTHTVDFFDSMAMRNRTALCVVLRMYLSDDPAVDDMATVEVEDPIRKRIRVPLSCLVCRYSGQRLPFSTDDS